MGFLAPIGMALMPALASAFGGAAAGTAAGAAATSLGATALGTGIGMAGNLLQGVGSYEQGMFQSKLSGYNAQLALGQKGQTLRAGDIGAQQELLKTAKEVGSVTAAQGAGGVDVGRGTQKDLQTATEAAGQYDAATVRYNAASRAYGLQQEYMSDMMQKQADKISAISGLIGGVLGAGNTFLGGATSMADKWLQYGTTGALNVPLTGSVVNSSATPSPGMGWGTEAGFQPAGSITYG